jgi:hypothetical protein
VVKPAIADNSTALAAAKFGLTAPCAAVKVRTLALLDLRPRAKLPLSDNHNWKTPPPASKWQKGDAKVLPPAEKYGANKRDAHRLARQRAGVPKVATHRPKSAANGVRFGEASNPGPPPPKKKQPRGQKRDDQLRKARKNDEHKSQGNRDGSLEVKRDLKADHEGKHDTYVDIEFFGRCHRCKKRGHKQSECRTPAAEVYAAVLTDFDPFADAPKGKGVKAGAPAPEPIIPKTPEQLAAEEEEKAEEKWRKEEERKVKCLQELKAKASLMWLTKDPDSPVDRSVVLASLSQTARADKVLGDEIDKEVLTIYRVALRSAVIERTKSAKELSLESNEHELDWGYADRFVYPEPNCLWYLQSEYWRQWARNYWQHFMNYIKLRNMGAMMGTQVELMHKFEAVQPMSRPSKSMPLAYVAAVFCHMFIFPILEEASKHIAGPLAHAAGLPHLNGFMMTFIMAMLPCVLIAVLESQSTARKLEQIAEVILRAAVHYLFGYLGFIAGWVLHVVWNSTVLMCHIAIGTSPRLLLNCAALSLSSSPTGVDRSPYLEIEATCLEGKRVKEVPVCKQFKYRPGDKVCKPSFGYRQFLSVRGIALHVFSGCCHNEAVSIKARVGKAVPVALPEVAKAVKRHWKSAMVRLSPIFDRLDLYQAKRMGFNDWVRRFPPRRRDALIATRNARGEYRDVSSSFIKRELAMRATETDAPYKDPRFIQGCDLTKSVALGPYVVPATKIVKAAFAPVAYSRQEGMLKKVRYMCGDSAEEVGKAFDDAIAYVERQMHCEDKLVFLEDDQSRFDLHMREGAFFALNQVYKRLMPQDTCKLLKRKSKSLGKTSNGGKYSIDYTMRSGDPDTSVGDTLANIIMKYDIHGSGLWVSIVMGDDSITVTTESLIQELGGVDGIVAKYAAFGMEIEAVVRKDKLSCEMCSSRFYPTIAGSILFPKPGKIIAKGLCDLRKRSAKEQAQWLKGIATTLEHYGAVDPLLHALSGSLRQSVGDGAGLVERSDYKFYQSKASKSVLASDAEAKWLNACIYYDHHYGISEAQVLHAMDVLRSTKLGDVITDSVVCHICATDCV